MLSSTNTITANMVIKSVIQAYDHSVARGEDKAQSKAVHLTPTWSHVADHMWSWDLTCKNKITFLIRISFPVWITKITLSKRQLIHRSLTLTPTNVNVAWTTGMLPSPPFLSIILPPSDTWKCDVNAGRRAPPTCKWGIPTKPHPCGDKPADVAKVRHPLFCFCFLTHSAYASDDDDGVPQPLWRTLILRFEPC